MATVTKKFTPRENVYRKNGILTLEGGDGAEKVASAGAVLNYDDAKKSGIADLFEKSNTAALNGGETLSSPPAIPMAAVPVAAMPVAAVPVAAALSSSTPTLPATPMPATTPVAAAVAPTPTLATAPTPGSTPTPAPGTNK